MIILFREVHYKAAVPINGYVCYFRQLFLQNITFFFKHLITCFKKSLKHHEILDAVNYFKSRRTYLHYLVGRSHFQPLQYRDGQHHFWNTSGSLESVQVDILIEVGEYFAVVIVCPQLWRSLEHYF